MSRNERQRRRHHLANICKAVSQCVVYVALIIPKRRTNDTRVPNDEREAPVRSVAVLFVSRVENEAEDERNQVTTQSIPPLPLQ